ncbi:PepSY domain-containing protein [Rhodovulum sp. PH10]|uniref:PepSY domain-containing protein n=1 Tax=Rhodovulum sp. PH10 TaxID=1187851 RepID=UPI00058F61A9|nr:PepSY domain-containing protein [Rhodovulum sp. PH10]
MTREAGRRNGRHTAGTVLLALGLLAGCGVFRAPAAEQSGARPHAASPAQQKREPAPGGPRCLTRAEQRTRTANHTVVSLARAMHAAKARRGEVVRARLCEQNGRLVYHLTVLPRGGKVVRATVDAVTGSLIASR